MTKTTYVPTEADALTGKNVRNLRRLAGETLLQTIERSGVNMKQSSLSRVELGQRQLSLPDATKLAAHFNTTADRIISRYGRPAPVSDFDGNMKPYARPAVTEQAWLGNTTPPPPPSLFVVPDEIHPDTDVAALQRLADDVFGPRILNVFEIDRDNPLTPEQYRAEIWIPYLEARYTAETA